MSSMKGGFSTLNRWFGKSKKDKSGVAGSAANGKLSKSTTQLHHLSTDSGMHINETSQLEYNRITPLPAATSNAPFEQTFRITVLLPKDQLYVARLGARVPLSKLLTLVCDNKQLDADKYEFRSPVDASQVYSCESTIGAVGLSEIRLCHKSESYDSFNADTMLKFQRTGAVRDSLSSSSDFSSSRHSKLTTKTPSPYSSSNSLNSMDSTGMNYTRTPVVPPKALPMAAPPRKKRAAPRPPSQLVIPEQTVAPAVPMPAAAQPEPAYAVIVKRPQMFVSTPNLSTTAELDCNGNSAKTPDADVNDGHYETLEVKSNASSNGLPEPIPRKRFVQLKKKAAPAPPPTDGTAADSISLVSTSASISETPEISETIALEPPQPAPRITTPLITPTPTPITPMTPPPLPASAAPMLANGNGNVSKVLLNRTPTPEPRSLSSAADEDDNDAASKQADSGIGEPVPSPSPLPDSSLPSEADLKSTFESSSDDDDAIKVYNFKLCQTSVKAEQQLPQARTLAELEVLTAAAAEDEELLSASGECTPAAGSVLPTPGSDQTSLSSWNYAVPISPPPDFSDQQQEQAKDRTMLQLDRLIEQPAGRPKSALSSPLDEIVDELSAIINGQRLDTLIRRQDTNSEIEAAKPNKLANFSIAAHGATTPSPARPAAAATPPKISAAPATQTPTLATPATSIKTAASAAATRSSPTQARITRADSFQASTTAVVPNGSQGLGLRSSSHMSLTKIEQNGLGLHQRRSSSELSIGESPSLQSLEVIKTILSSRKNSSAGDSIGSAGSAGSTPTKPASPQLLQPAAKPKSVMVDTPAVKQQQQQQQQQHVTPVIAASVDVSEAAPAKTETQALPPTYRYSGPPSINFATWSERPKSQVAIKNEGDYIFGGKQSAQQQQQQQQQQRSSSPAPAHTTKLTIEAAAPILRMGIPLKEYKVPITVKPLRDEESVAKETPAPQLQPSTLPRPNKSNRFTLPASSFAESKPTAGSNSLPRPLSTLDKMQAQQQQTQPAAPFGQNTLRRTGFKEKMLAKEQEEKEQALRVRSSVTLNGTSTTSTTVATPTQTQTQTPAVTAAPQVAVKPKTVIKSSKLELKLQQPNTTESSPSPIQFKLRPTSMTPTAATPSPPPPPAPVLLNKTKPRSIAAVTPTSPDPRSQLLDAIRNFKREELNCA